MVIKETANNGYDTPLGPNWTSSLGPLKMPPEKTSFERKKGFATELLTDRDKIEHFIAQLIASEFENDVTRITARCIVPLTLIAELISLGQEFIETVIPLEGCGIEELEGTCLVYMARNHVHRMSPSDILLEQQRGAEEIYQRNQGMAERVCAPLGFFIELITDEQRTSRQIVEMYRTLYTPFGWNEEDIFDLLNSNNNLLVAAFDNNGRIVSSGIAEVGALNLTTEGKNIEFTVAEITEAATLPEFRGRNLYQSVSNYILRYLAKLVRPNLVFGELNLDAPGVLKVAVRQGRTPALETAKRFGLPRAWYLDQHVTIASGDGTERRGDYPYNNLMVAYMPQSFLLENYGDG